VNNDSAMVHPKICLHSSTNRYDAETGIEAGVRGVT